MLKDSDRNHNSVSNEFDSEQESSASTDGSANELGKVHCALVFGQVCFGVGSVVTAIGLPAVHPFVFALYREIAAGLILLLAAATIEHDALKDLVRQESLTAKVRTTKRDPFDFLGDFFQSLIPSRDRPRFLLLGFLVFGCQACYIAGLKLAGPVTGAVWQPSQPLLTAGLSMALGQEPKNVRRIAGIFIAFCGCSVMVFSSAGVAVSAENDADGNNPEKVSSYATKTIAGNLFFLCNCLCTSVYVLSSRTTSLHRYPPLLITAVTYNTAAIFMTLTSFLVKSSAILSFFFCPECQLQNDSTGYWSIPPAAFNALAYNVIFTSVLAYGILMWANKKSSTGTIVMAYTALQPVTAAILTGFLVQILKLIPECKLQAKEDEGKVCLDPPGFGSLIGTIAVLVGLFLVLKTEPSKDRNTGADGGWTEMETLASKTLDHDAEDGMKHDTNEDDFEHFLPKQQHEATRLDTQQ